MTTEKIGLLRQLTIVIPTIEKPEVLERAIEYWRDLSVTVHIVDGSEKPWFQIGALQNIPTITYHHLPAKPGEDILENYSRRLRFATTLTSTKYSALCADDDFFTISGLCGIIQTLSNDDTLDAMIGRAALYNKTEAKLIWRLRYADLRNSEDYRSENVSTRLLNPDRAPWLYYGIIKTDLWKKLFQISLEHSYNKQTEKLLSIVDKSLCRIQIIERIVWIRQDYVPRTHSGDIHVPVPIFKNVLSKKRFTNQRKMRKQIVIAIQHSSPNISKFRAFRLARKTSAPKILRRHPKLRRIKKIVIRKLIKFFSFIAPGTRQKIIKSLPWRISGPLGYYKIKPETLAATSRTSLDEFLTLLQKSDVNFDPSELRDFENLLRKPREELRLRADI